MDTNKTELLKNVLDAINREDVPALSSLLKEFPYLVNGTPYGNEDDFGYLDYAIFGGSISIVKEFVAHGADVNRMGPGPLFQTPLCNAAYKGQIEIVKLLLERGAFVDGVDLTAATPLMIAAQQGHIEIVKALVRKGAELQRLGYVQRFFPVDFAQSYAEVHGNEDCTPYLREHGGISVSDDYDWEKEKGYQIIAHVSRNGGPVYPIGFLRTVNGEGFLFRLSEIRAKDDPLFIFSAGLYLYGNPVEIGIALPGRWPLLKNYLQKKTKLTFPLDILEIVSNHIAAGKDFTEGFVIDKNEPVYNELAWPSDVTALIAVNHKWGEEDSVSLKKINSRNDVSSPEVVSIFTLIPVIEGTKFSNTKPFVEKWCASKSKAKWAKIILPLPY